jgi:hypothetical protein
MVKLRFSPARSTHKQSNLKSAGVFKMKNRFMLSVLVVLFALTSSTNRSRSAFAANSDDHGGQIVSHYDGFNHETVITLQKMKVTCSSARGNFKAACVSFVAALHCPGIQLDYVRNVSLQLIFETKDWDQRHPLDRRALSVVADGETYRLGQMILAGQKVDTLMSETLEVSIPYKIFKRIALAENVEFQVGKGSFALRDKNLSALRDLNNRVKFSARS